MVQAYLEVKCIVIFALLSCSSITFLYKRYKQPMPADLKEELKDLLEGVNRTVALAKQSG